MAIDYAKLKKGGFMRQKQKGKFSMRLAVVAGQLTAENLRVIQEVADKYGNGTVHLTSRQSVEIPFVDYNDIEAVRELLATGNVQPGVCGPRVRTVTGCQGNLVCPSGNINSYDIAKKINDRYFARELPGKFKFGVTGCQNNCLKSEENDLGVKGALDVSWLEDKCVGCGVCEKACRQNCLKTEEGTLKIDFTNCNHCGRCVKACPFDAWEGKSAYLVSVGGLFGNNIVKGEPIVPLIKDEETLFRVTDATIDFFDQNAKPGERFRFTIDRVGREKLKEVVMEAYHGND